MKTKKVSVVITVCMFTASLFTTAFAQKDSKKTAIKENEKKFETMKMEKDAEFVVKAYDASRFEVMAGELAKTKATSQQVKDLAMQVVKDHSMINSELKSLASKNNITVPEKISDKLQKKYDNLNEKTSEDFDKDYLKDVVREHKDEIDLFEKQAEKGEMESIKSWASGKIPTLQKHLEKAESVLDNIREVSVK